MNTAKEFKGFVVKGNIADLAVGVIIGAAFGKVVTSLVNDRNARSPQGQCQAMTLSPAD